jgi:hypothetical protein
MHGMFSGVNRMTGSLSASTELGVGDSSRSVCRQNVWRTCRLTMRCSGRLASARRLQGHEPARTGGDQQAARRLRAAADRGR